MPATRSRPQPLRLVGGSTGGGDAHDAQTPRIALYSHDALGLGHLRRNLALAGALCTGQQQADRPDVLLFAGALESTDFARPEGCDLITLPSVRKEADGSYGARQLSLDLSDLVMLRSSILSAALTAFAPDVLIIDRHPQGAFGELLPALRELRTNGRTKIVLGLRDVLDDPVSTIAEWQDNGCTEVVEEFVDQIWIYGDPDVYDAVQEYDLPPAVARKVVYTGYLGSRASAGPLESLPTTPFVLGMVGGGQDGRELGEAFAAMPLPPGVHGLLVTGPQMAVADRHVILAHAAGRDDMTVVERVADGAQWIRGAAAVVTMGGYNSVCELLAAGTPGVVVPRVSPRLEQWIRAERLAGAGLVDVLHPAELSPSALGHWAAAAVRRPSRRLSTVDLDGLSRLPALVDELVNGNPITTLIPSGSRSRMTTTPPTDRRRIGYVLKMYPRFSETFIVSELLAREAAGADIDVFSLRPPVDGRFHEALARVRAGVTYLGPPGRRGEDVWRLLGTAGDRLWELPAALPELLAAEIGDAAQAVELALLVQARGITHLHAHFASVATTVARLASRLSGVPYSFTAHAKDIFHNSVDAADLRRKLRDAHHVVTVSEYNSRYLRDRFGAAADSVRLVYNGLDLDAFPYLPPVDRAPVVAAVGRLVEKKGFDVLVEACALLHQTGRTFSCRIAGGGDQYDALQALIAKRALTDVVQLLGPLPQTQVRALVAGAAAVAAPCVVGADGNRDGLPTVLLEAMALGTPCVSTDVTGIPEVVRDGQSGLLVDQNDPASLARALGRLLDEPALGIRLAQHARARVEADFDSVGQAAILHTLMTEVSGTPAAAVA